MPPVPESATSPDAARPADAAETALVERLRAGDRDAFGELVRTQTGRLLALGRRMLGNEEDARDAVQETLLSVCRKIGSFCGDSQLSTWMHRIAVNVCLMRMRARRSRPELAIEDLMPQFTRDGHHVEPPALWPEDALARAAAGEERALVRAAIDRLPDTYRSILLLRDIEQLDTQEVARLLEITPNAVKVRLHRARQALKTLLDPHLRESAS